MATTSRLNQIVEQATSDLGYELVATEFSPGRGEGILRVFIDAPEGIGLKDCETVSRRLSILLDVEDPIPGRYNLEVSSPGIERPLVKPEHFRRFVGERARVETFSHHLGRKRFLGQICDALDDEVLIEVDGEIYTLPYADIDKARLKPEW